MTDTVRCRRCLQEKPGLAGPPVPGPVGEEVQAAVCADCWADWERAEVMVINELRLNFMDPKAEQILTDQMREFLALPSDAGAAGPAE